MGGLDVLPICGKKKRKLIDQSLNFLNGFNKYVSTLENTTVFFRAFKFIKQICFFFVHDEK